MGQIRKGTIPMQSPLSGIEGTLDREDTKSAAPPTLSVVLKKSRVAKSNSGERASAGWEETETKKSALDAHIETQAGWAEPGNLHAISAAGPSLV